MNRFNLGVASLSILLFSAIVQKSLAQDYDGSTSTYLEDTGRATNAVDAITKEPENQPIGDSNSVEEPKGNPMRIAVFERPCHFPILESGSWGTQHTRDALVIYEGMSLEVFDHGRYQLTFVAEVPRTPVTMRLQLTLQPTQGNANWSQRSITISPVTIEPGQDLMRHQPGQLVRIKHVGYSHVLDRIQSQSDADWNLAKLKVGRHGVARFGSIPERGEYSIVDPTSATTASKSDSADAKK